MPFTWLKVGKNEIKYIVYKTTLGENFAKCSKIEINVNGENNFSTIVANRNFFSQILVVQNTIIPVSFLS